MQITERDVEILKWVNRMRFAAAKQVAEKFGMGIWVVYRRIRKLTVNGYLAHVRPLKNTTGVWMCTERGAGFSGEGLWAPARRINVATFNHDLTVIDLSIALEKKGTGKWVSERELRLGKDYRKKVPDGMFLKDGKEIACEVELTRKSRKYLDRVMSFYKSNIEYDEVWYFVPGDAVGRAVEKAADGIDFVKIYYLKEALGDEKSIK